MKKSFKNYFTETIRKTNTQSLPQLLRTLGHDQETNSGTGKGKERAEIRGKS
jgi:hypothetical protein